jgi:von Willebrand factor type A domain
MLSGRDYTLVIDKSGSMAQKDQPGGRSRWAVAQESAHAFAAKCEELDPDGLTLYVFGGRFRRYDNVTSSRVALVFRENEPCGSTDLAAVLKDAFDAYFTRKVMGKGTRPETLVVVTDGEPDDPRAVMRVIVDASRKLDRDEELAVTFVQIGQDPEARRFLRILDDELVRGGAKFDICDTVTVDEAETMGLTEVLLHAIHD